MSLLEKLLLLNSVLLLLPQGDASQGVVHDAARDLLQNIASDQAVPAEFQARIQALRDSLFAPAPSDD